MADERAGYPRPQGADRTSDPLLGFTDDVVEAWLDILWHSSHLSGVVGGTPISQALSGRRRAPRPGDLVYVPDAASPRTRSTGNARYGFGYLIERRREPVHTDAEWAEHGHEWGDDPRPTEPVFYVQYGPQPQDVCRWVNASVEAVPRSGEFAEDVQRDAQLIAKEVVWRV